MKKAHAIKIYNDTGVDQISLFPLIYELSNWETSFISSKEIIQTCWEPYTSLLIIPGGRDVPFHESLKGEGNHKIRKYVENGGSFLGVCAGAYYGCSAIEFDCGNELEVLGTRELAFFPGIARGPIYGPGSFRYHSEFGAKAVMVSNYLEKEQIKVYYNGGCYFVDAERHPQVKLISRYLDIEECPAAIIEISIGKGKAILSGIHIEMGTSYPLKSFKKAMIKTLEPYETQRKRFFQHILYRLLN